MARRYPRDYGHDIRDHLGGRAGRLQNLLLWDGTTEDSTSTGGKTFREIFGDRNGSNPTPFGDIIEHCKGRLDLAKKWKDRSGFKYLEPKRKNRVVEAAEDLQEALEVEEGQEVWTLERLMVTNNEEWPENVELYSMDLEAMGITLPHMHRDKSDIKALEDLFHPNIGKFYEHLGDMTPAKLYTAPPPSEDVRKTVEAARKAHALTNHPDLPDRFDPQLSGPGWG